MTNEKWTSQDIDDVEDIYIGLWSQPVAGPKLKVFIDAVQRFPPRIVIRAMEWIAKTQEKDLRPAIKSICQQSGELMPKDSPQPAPCDERQERQLTFKEYYREFPDVDVPEFMQRFLSDDDPRKIRPTNGTKARPDPELGAAQDTDQPQHISEIALG